MTQPQDPELTGAEREALAALRASRPAPPGLEDRVVGALRERRLVRPGHSLRRILLGTSVAASLVAAFFLGALVARRPSGPAAGDAGQPRFLMLLHSTAEDRSRPTDREQVEAYAAWAREERARGRLESGEKLEDGGLLLIPGSPTPRRAPMPDTPAGPLLGGYFVIRAPDYDTAAEIAADCPHVRGGGVVEVRKIEQL